MSDDLDNSSIIIVSTERRVCVRVGCLSCTNVGYLFMSVRNVKTANRVEEIRITERHLEQNSDQEGLGFLKL